MAHEADARGGSGVGAARKRVQEEVGQPQSGEMVGLAGLVGGAPGDAVDDLAELDLAYAPPYSPVFAPVQVAGRSQSSESHCVSVGSCPLSWAKIFTKTGTRNATSAVLGSGT